MKSYQTNHQEGRYTRVQYHQTASEKIGQRIDNYLINLLKIPKSRIYTLLRKGSIRVNKKRIQPNYRLLENDNIRIPPFFNQLASSKNTVIPEYRKAGLLDQILYEDDQLIVLNKPSGFAVHGGSGLNYGVIEALRKARPTERSLELVHRLDKATSGCLMISKRQAVLRYLHEQLREKKIVKTYLALLKGQLTENKVIELPLKKNQLNSGERIVRVSPEAGQVAKTLFRPKQHFEQATLVLAQPVTGRTHQIRVHANSMGHPIAGDPKYGCTNFNLMLHKKGLNRLFLHAHTLEFYLPSQKKPVFIEAPLSEALSSFITSFSVDR